MARKTEKGEKFRNVNCRTWNMARKLKISLLKEIKVQTVEPRLKERPSRDCLNLAPIPYTDTKSRFYC